MLEDQSHELAESQARLDDEARFRVALEAHPGILLVVDPDGRIGYANAQALQSLRYVPDQIRTVHLRDLLTTAPAVGQPTQGVQLAEARRRDGTTFPVDYAVSTFDLGGETYSIAVLTDISERLQTERLRDTFIGMLSHELRTPVTSIYGGSQVLLNRGDRLEAATRQELIADVASEAERLHRLIENLLVLARVERGQDLAGDEPVLLQRVLPLIVERERSLWPGTNIEMTLPRGPADRPRARRVRRSGRPEPVEQRGQVRRRRSNRADRRLARGLRRGRARARQRRRHPARACRPPVRPLLPGAGRRRPSAGRRDRPVRLPPHHQRAGRDHLGAVETGRRRRVRLRAADLRARGRVRPVPTSSSRALQGWPPLS